MASNTENLNLLMKNPSTDGADTFNVQTMLNDNWQKIDNNAGTVAQTLANILKPTTPPIIGLPPSTTPDGMFQALGNTGELHVWRKTVVNASEKPAGYTLGSGTNLTLVKSTERYGQGSTYWVPAASISVNDGGAINEITGSSVQVYYEKEESELKSAFWGKFIKFSSESDYGNVPDKDGVWFIPNSATIQKTTGGNYYYLTVVGAQKVNPYPLTPAGTTTTYPVSTNPNAYQEGDDAKEAGYVVGEKKNVTINGMNGPIILTGNSLTVADDGTLSVTSPAQYGVYNSSTTEDVRSVVAGKYIYIPYNSGSVGFFKVPSDVIVTGSTAPAGGSVFAFTAQPVTGYPAIPAGTTIEYLGRLGDKARVQVVSYVGTGTYGGSNPNSLTFDFVPKMVIIRQENDAYAKFDWIIGITNVEVHWDGSYNCFVAIDGKKLSFYSLNGSLYQMNQNGEKYYAIAIG